MEAASVNPAQNSSLIFFFFLKKKDRHVERKKGFAQKDGRMNSGKRCRKNSRRRRSRRADWAVWVLEASGELPHTSINNMLQISRLEGERRLLEVCRGDAHAPVFPHGCYCTSLVDAQIETR